MFTGLKPAIATALVPIITDLSFSTALGHAGAGLDKVLPLALGAGTVVAVCKWASGNREASEYTPGTTVRAPVKAPEYGQNGQVHRVAGEPFQPYETR